MITATDTIARIAKPMISAAFGFVMKPPIAAGAWLTMPAKMMKLMPLPMPFSVISSPSHIRAIEPAVSVAIWVSVAPLPRSNPDDRTPCELSSARNPYACRTAIGTDR